MAFIRKNPKLIFFLTGVGFIAGGIDSFENELIILAISSYIVGGLNVIAYFFVKRHPFSVKMAILFLNMVFAALSSYSYHIAGMDIQYGWALVCLIHIVAIIVTYYKQSKKG